MSPGLLFLLVQITFVLLALTGARSGLLGCTMELEGASLLACTLLLPIGFYVCETYSKGTRRIRLPKLKVAVSTNIRRGHRLKWPRLLIWSRNSIVYILILAFSVLVFSQNGVSLDNRRYIVDNTDALEIKAISGLLTSLWIVAQLIFQRKRLRRNVSEDILYVIVSVCVIVLEGFTTMARGRMVLASLITIGFIANKWVRKRILPMAVVTTTVVIAYFAIDYYRSPDIYGERFIFLYERASLLFVAYIVGPTVSATNALILNYTPTYGHWSGGGILRLMADQLSITGSDPLYGRVDTDIGCTTINSYAYFYYMILDFGFTGSVLICSVFGYISGAILRKRRSRQMRAEHYIIVCLLYGFAAVSPRDLILVWKMPWILLLTACGISMIRSLSSRDSFTR